MHDNEEYYPQGDGLVPVEADESVKDEEYYFRELRLFTEPYIAGMKEIHILRAKHEWFYALFYAYEECNMDDSLNEMYNYICRAYPVILGKNNHIETIFKTILSTNDFLTKKYLALIMIGNEPDIAGHILKEAQDQSITTITTKNNYDIKKIQKFGLDKTNRLLVVLPGLVGPLTTKPINQYNVTNIIKIFIAECINVYEMG